MSKTMASDLSRVKRLAPQQPDIENIKLRLHPRQTRFVPGTGQLSTNRTEAGYSNIGNSI